MQIDTHLWLTEKDVARCSGTEDRVYLSIRTDDCDLAVWLPRRVPAEKLQTIADAINDALDCARASAQMEAVS